MVQQNKYFLFLLIAHFAFHASSQVKRNANRMEMLNKSVVKILLDDVVYGTGFFVHEKGIVGTCWHVIEPSFREESGQLVPTKNIFVQLVNGEKMRAEIHPVMYSDLETKKTMAYDAVLLKIEGFVPNGIKVLKLGKWEEVNEFDNVYVPGFPLRTKHISFSMGKLSSKHETRFYELSSKGDTTRTFIRNQAYADLTFNSGNSGGPAIKLGNSPNKDVVIGLATEAIAFPLGKNITDYRNKYREAVNVKGKNSTETEREMLTIFESLNMMPSGIGIIISTDYMLELLEEIKTQ